MDTREQVTNGIIDLITNPKPNAESYLVFYPSLKSMVKKCKSSSELDIGTYIGSLESKKFDYLLVNWKLFCQVRDLVGEEAMCYDAVAEAQKIINAPVVRHSKLEDY